jgi:hypothetical protein
MTEKYLNMTSRAVNNIDNVFGKIGMTVAGSACTTAIGVGETGVNIVKFPLVAAYKFLHGLLN